jgi:ligand-binding sensor domain-containing protein/signal transduction histidine kinase
MNQLLPRLLGFILVLALASCGSGTPLPATPKIDSTATSLPEAPSRFPSTSIPEVCNCVLRFDTINIEQGLSQSSVHAILQDKSGFLWFGTEDGLNRYDGYTFKTFKPDRDNINSLSDRWITSIVEDQDGYLWLGTRHGGLNQYNPHTEQFTQFRHDELNPSSLSDDRINTLYVDIKGNLWVGTPSGLDLFQPEQKTFFHYVYNPNNPSSLSGQKVLLIYQDQKEQYWIGTDGGLDRFEPGRGVITSYQHNPDDENTLSNNRVTSLVESTGDTLWVGTQKGLNKINLTTGVVTRFMTGRLEPLSPINNTINTLYTDHSGNLWVGTTAGLDRLSNDGSRFIHYYNDPAFPKSLSNNTVLSIFQDRGGVLWIGTYGGINKYDRGRDKFAYFRNEPGNPNSLSGNYVTAVLVNRYGSIWVGTNSNGLNLINWLSGDVTHYHADPQTSNGLASDEILSLAFDHEGMIWIGTANGLDKLDPSEDIFTHYRSNTESPYSLGSNTIYTLYEDSQNVLWVGTGAGLERFNRATNNFTHYYPEANNPRSLSGSNVTAIHEDDQGFLWVGTLENGLNRFDRHTGTFTHYQYNQQDSKSLSNDSILSIYQDSKGRLWIGTSGGGLNLYHPETDSFTYLFEKDGLANGVVYGILEDENRYLWMSTNHGISRFDPETNTFRNFDAGDGLQGNEFSMGAYAKGINGKLHFGGVNGLTVFDPLNIIDNPVAPQITLISISQDGVPIKIDPAMETKNITLRWPHNSFEFEYAALSYNQPLKNNYAYMLKGFDNTWNYIGTKRNGRYTNLAGGSYTLLLRATNSDGVWNTTPARIHVTVVPPFWATLWFRILLVFAVLGAVAGGIGLRTRSIQDRNRQLERLVRDRTSALEKRNQEIQALYQADERILRNVSLQQVFQTLVDVAVDTLSADRSIVFAWDEKRTKVRPRVSRGYLPETLKVLQFAKGEGYIGKVLETGVPAIVRQMDINEFREDVREALIAEGIRSFVHLPIIVDNKIVGVFNVSFIKPNLIGDDITRLFSALTNRASISIANMQLFEQTKDLAVMEERNRLARDLHDSAKQKAFAALAQLGTARGIIKGNGNPAYMHLNEAENLVSDVIQELTFLVQEIYPIALQEKGLPTSLREYMYEWENRNEMKVSFSMRNERPLPLGIEQAIYRVTQESLANVARHSQATQVEVSLMYNSDSLHLSVSDNGRGFDVELKGHGLGLRSIRERVASIHGTVQIQSAPGQGTKIIVQAPIKD